MDAVTFQSTTPATPPATTPVAVDDVGGVQVQVVKLDVGGDGVSVPVVGALPVSGPATDAQLRATPLPVSGTVATGGLTDAQLRTSAVPVSLANPSLTAAAPTFATVGTSSAQAVASNANRKGLVLVNRSANVISLGFGQTAVLDSGITLEPMGGEFTMTKDTFTTAAVNAIAGAASSKLAIQEYTT